MNIKKNTKTKIKLYFILIVVQLVVIVSLGYWIHQAKTKVLGTEIYNPIDMDSMIINPNSTLLSFYEPKADTVSKLVNEQSPSGATYTINSDSLNERFNYPTEKPDNTFRIITLGDSFTYGLFVSTEDNYTEKLEDLLNNNLSCDEIEKFEVINLGVQGYDIQYSLARYRFRGLKYNPDLVLWLLKDDDFMTLNELMLSRENLINQKLREAGEFDKLATSKSEYPTWARAFNEIYAELGDEKLLKQQMIFLQEFRNIYNGPLLIFSFPHTKGLYDEFMNLFAHSQKSVYVYNNLVDTSRLDGCYYPNDGHPTQKGHKLIAEDLFKYLTQGGLVPCD